MALGPLFPPPPQTLSPMLFLGLKISTFDPPSSTNDFLSPWVLSADLYLVQAFIQSSVWHGPCQQMLSLQ